MERVDYLNTVAGTWETAQLIDPTEGNKYIIRFTIDNDSLVDQTSFMVAGEKFFIGDPLNAIPFPIYFSWLSNQLMTTSYLFGQGFLQRVPCTDEVVFYYDTEPLTSSYDGDKIVRLKNAIH